MAQSCSRWLIVIVGPWCELDEPFSPNGPLHDNLADHSARRDVRCAGTRGIVRHDGSARGKRRAMRACGRDRPAGRRLSPFRVCRGWWKWGSCVCTAGDTLSGRRRGELAGESVFLTRDVERVVWTLSVVRAVAMVCEIDVLLRVICAGRQAGCGRRFGQYRRRRVNRERCILSPVLNCCWTCEEPLGSGDRIQMSKKTSTDGRRRSRAAHRPRSVVDVK